MSDVSEKSIEKYFFTKREFFQSRATRLYTPLCPSIRRSVCPSVTFYFFHVFYSLTSLLLPKWSSDLKNGPCPSARDQGSRVSCLVLCTWTFVARIQNEISTATSPNPNHTQNREISVPRRQIEVNSFKMRHKNIRVTRVHGLQAMRVVVRRRVDTYKQGQTEAYTLQGHGRKGGLEGPLVM